MVENKRKSSIRMKDHITKTNFNSTHTKKAGWRLQNQINLRQIRGIIARPEAVTMILLIVSFVIASRLSEYFLDVRYLLNSTSLYVEIGIMALGMTYIIISSNIDLSVASQLALIACVTAVVQGNLGAPMILSIVIGLLLGIVLGALNGLLIVKLRLPALALTLGTMLLYRGIAQIFLGDHSLGKFPDWFKGFDYHYLGNLPIPLPLVVFIVLAVLMGVILHKSTFGRYLYAIGINETASRLVGIPVDRMKIAIFTLMGFLSAIAGLMMASRLQVSRFDMASEALLDVVTIVVLGGTSIFGGRGTMFGTVIALFLIIILRTGLGVANVRLQYQLAIIGSIFILGVVVSNTIERIKKE